MTSGGQRCGDLPGPGLNSRGNREHALLLCVMPVKHLAAGCFSSWVFRLRVGWNFELYVPFEMKGLISEGLTLAKLLQSCPTLCNPMDCSPPGASVHGNSPGKNTGVGCRALLWGDLPDSGIEPIGNCGWSGYPGSLAGYQKSLLLQEQRVIAWLAGPPFHKSPLIMG